VANDRPTETDKDRKTRHIYIPASTRSVDLSMSSEPSKRVDDFKENVKSHSRELILPHVEWKLRSEHENREM
jgi:hypothetical protein